jgi:hypothetical protein
MATKKPKKRAEKYEEKVKAEGSFSDLMSKLFPKAKPKKDVVLPKIKPKN